MNNPSDIRQCQYGRVLSGVVEMPFRMRQLVKELHLFASIRSICIT